MAASGTDADGAAAGSGDQLPLDDLLQLLSLETRVDIRSTALEYVLGLTASRDGKELLRKEPRLVEAVVKLTGDQAIPEVTRDAFTTLVNLSAEQVHCDRMLDAGVLDTTLDIIYNPEYKYPDEPCMLLANLTRAESVASRLLNKRKSDDKSHLLRLIDIFVLERNYNKHGQYHHLGSVIFNSTRLAEARDSITLRIGEGCVLQRLLPFLNYQESIIRRGGIVGTIRNCCFDAKNHEWLLSDEVNILTHLLLPLAGPEELEEDDMEGMPDDLQYLPPDKKREPDADLRKMLLETLLQLGATLHGRKTMREQKVYPILREMHKVEPEEDVQETCAQVVDFLIGDESGIANLREMEVPLADAVATTYTTAQPPDERRTLKDENEEDEDEEEEEETEDGDKDKS